MTGFGTCVRASAPDLSAIMTSGVWRPEGCHAILVTGSSPPASQNWVQLEDGEGRDMVDEGDRDMVCLSLLRREASKLAGQVSACSRRG